MSVLFAGTIRQNVNFIPIMCLFFCFEGNCQLATWFVSSLLPKSSWFNPSFWSIFARKGLTIMYNDPNRKDFSEKYKKIIYNGSKQNLTKSAKSCVIAFEGCVSLMVFHVLVTVDFCFYWPWIMAIMFSFLHLTMAADMELTATKNSARSQANNSAKSLVMQKDRMSLLFLRFIFSLGLS